MANYRTSLPALLVGMSLVPLFLSGCTATSVRGPNGSPLPDVRTGNWQVSSSDVAAANLSTLSGSLTGSSSALTAVFHAQSVRSCVVSKSPILVSGAVDTEGKVNLTGPLAGGTVTISGDLSTDGQSLTGATFNVAGGTCGFPKAALAQAQVYMPISGIYNGTFRDGDGQVAAVQATLNQSADANGDGNFTLTGSAAPNNPCFAASVPISNTTVSGGNFSFTYTDPTTSNSVTASGTFSADASTLTVTNWASSGPCGADSGTGTMTRQ